MNKLTVEQREQTVSEEQRIAKALAERDAKQALQQLEEEERRAAMLNSIAAHREFMVNIGSDATVTACNVNYWEIFLLIQ